MCSTTNTSLITEAAVKSEKISSSSTNSVTTTEKTMQSSDSSPTLADLSAVIVPNSDGNETEIRGVTFGNIEIREYSRCLGNNPATTHGPPLSIDWRYEDAGTFKLDEYEETRPPRRISNEMLVPGSLREIIILEQTHSTKKQINAIISEIRATRHRRQMTVAMQEFEHWHIALETIQRRMRRFKTGVSKKREEELLWENAQIILAEKPAAANEGLAAASE